MSHFTSVKTKIKDKSALIQALKNMGLNPQINTQAVNLKTRWQTTALAEIVIPQKQLGEDCEADLGFHQTEDGYQINADDYELNKSNYPHFKQDLGTEYACVLAQKNGYKILSREQGANGKMQIRLQAVNPVKVRR